MISIPVIFGVICVGFVLMHVVPTDPAAMLAGEGVTEEDLQKIRQTLGLDRPIIQQFFGYLGRVLTGNLGRSIINRASVIEELSRTIGPTFELMFASLLWSVPLGIVLGTMAAVRRGTFLDRIIMAVSIATVSLPVFMLGLLLIMYLGLSWQLFPFQGRGGPLWTLTGLKHIVLPALTLGSLLIGPISRMTRTTLLEVLGREFIRTARAKGVRESAVIVKHGLRNAMIPTVTVIGLQAGYLLGGAVVTETIFAWPGVGRLAVGGISAGDFPIALGTILILSLSFIFINLVVDVVYSYLDPTVRKS
jgi:peptide/nickel transport system permease protein/oligopeptide transport system permease protein